MTTTRHSWKIRKSEPVVNGLFAGLPPDEIKRLHWEDISLEHDQIRLSGAIERKPIGFPTSGRTLVLTAQAQLTQRNPSVRQGEI
jgi:hypothetical protein